MGRSWTWSVLLNNLGQRSVAGPSLYCGRSATREVYWRTSRLLGLTSRTTYLSLHYLVYSQVAGGGSGCEELTCGSFLLYKYL
ncbi:hypothetical protein HD554DRAFT_2046157 [Boletus coccyginus]|nr:hypothetical protein HD554DRAFT_2046157 [Boletus coccyginus]